MFVSLKGRLRHLFGLYNVCTMAPFEGQPKPFVSTNRMCNGVAHIHQILASRKSFRTWIHDLISFRFAADVKSAWCVVWGPGNHQGTFSRSLGPLCWRQILKPLSNQESKEHWKKLKDVILWETSSKSDKNKALEKQKTCQVSTFCIFAQ